MNRPKTEVPIMNTSWNPGLVNGLPWSTEGGKKEFGEKIQKELSYSI